MKTGAVSKIIILEEILLSKGGQVCMYSSIRTEARVSNYLFGFLSVYICSYNIDSNIFAGIGSNASVCDFECRRLIYFQAPDRF